MDRRLFFLIYNYTAERPGLRKFAGAVAAFSKSFFFIIYGIGALWLLVDAPYNLVRFLVIPFLTLCYNSFLRKRIGRVRPFVRFELKPLLSHEANGSCPSNHAASAVVISMAFWLISPYISLALMIIAFFTGVSRICAGVHYPVDVLLGWLIGGVVGVVGFVIL